MTKDGQWMPNIFEIEEHTELAYEHKTEDDVEVLQSAKTTAKAPNLNIFELLVQTPFIGND